MGLPPLSYGASEWHLPLVDRAAVLCEVALLAESKTERHAALAQALAADPGFAAWCCLRRALKREQLPRNCDSAAALLLEGWPSALRGLASYYPPGELEEVARARSAAIALARGYRQADDVTGDEDYFAGLLSVLPGWISIANLAGTASEHDSQKFAAYWLRVRDTEQDVGRRALAVRDPIAARGPACGEPVAELPIAERLVGAVALWLSLDQASADFAERLELAKLDALKELAYGASHEVNNPLANISARAQTLLRGENDPERRRTLLAIHSQALRAHEMISDLMLFARPPELCPSRCDLDALVTAIIEELRDDAAEQQATLRWSPPSNSIAIWADATQLGVAIKALVQNAIEAVEPGGVISVRLAVDSPDACDTWCELAVADNGPGLSFHVRQHLFDPFFSGREAGRGLGFGLCKCWRIARQHGGGVHADSRLGQGTTMTLRLPIHGDFAVSETAAVSSPRRC